MAKPRHIVHVKVSNMREGDEAVTETYRLTAYDREEVKTRAVAIATLSHPGCGPFGFLSCEYNVEENRNG